MGIISLEGMEFFSYHGCFNEEQIIGNKFIIDLSVTFNSKEAEHSDLLSETIDYQIIYDLIKTEMKNNSYLLENIAYRISNKIRNKFYNILHIQIKISKLNPPLGGKIDKVSFTYSSDFQ